MLLRFLVRDRESPIAPHHRFRWRGDGVSRIEGLSDAVFGFAITLLVVSLEAPRNVHDLMALARGFIPFVASFLVLFNIWRLQFAFFRRYGLEDKPTEMLTGALLVMVLFFVYPLKFLFTAFGNALLAGDFGVLKGVMRIDDVPKVLALYAFGIFGLMFVFSLLYRHAYSKRESLQLNALEEFDTVAMMRRMQHASVVPLAILLWSGAQLLISEHMHARDNVFVAVYVLGYALIILSAIRLRVLVRSTARERKILAASLPAPEAIVRAGDL